jgi:hypothetical protein
MYEMITSEELLNHIRASFQGACRPALDEIARSAASLDGREVVERFRELDVDSIDDLLEIGVTSAEDLYHMTPQAISYFLPCYLRYVVKPRDFWEYSIVAGLIEFMDRDSGIKSGVAYPAFTTEQVSSIQKTLEYLREHLDRYGLGPMEKENRERLKTISRHWSNRG